MRKTNQRSIYAFFDGREHKEKNNSVRNYYRVEDGPRLVLFSYEEPIAFIPPLVNEPDFCDVVFIMTDWISMTTRIFQNEVKVASVNRRYAVIEVTCQEFRRALSSVDEALRIILEKKPKEEEATNA